MGTRGGFRWMTAIVSVLAIATLLAAAGCGDSNGATEEQTDATEQGVPTIELLVYFVSAGENAIALTREVPETEAVARAAMEELLAGPTADETATQPAISTAIPEGTSLLDIVIDDGVATVDLSKEYESGSGTFSMSARLAQVVYTLCQFETVDSVLFSIDGTPVEVFSSEGLVLDGPQTPEHFDELLPVDA